MEKIVWSGQVVSVQPRVRAQRFTDLIECGYGLNDEGSIS